MPSSGSAQRPAAHRTDCKYLLLTLHLPSFSMGFGLGLTVLVILELAQQAGVASGVAAYLVMLPLLGKLVAALPTGFFIDKLGRRRVLLAGPIITVVASLLVVKVALEGADGSFLELMIYHLIVGLGGQMWMMSRITVIADTGASNQRGKQVTQMRGLYAAGIAFSPVIGLLMAELWGLWIPFVIHAAIILIALIPSYFLLRETAPPVRPGQDANPGVPQSGPWRAMLQAPVSTVLLVHFLLKAALTGIPAGGIFFVYASYAYGTTSDDLDSLSGIVGTIGLVTVFAAGFVMDRFGRKYTIVPGFILLGSVMVLAAFVVILDVSYAWFAAVFIVAQMPLYITTGSTTTLGTDVAPEAARGRFFGVLETIGTGGTVTGIFAVALAQEVGFAAALFFLGLIAFAGALVAIFLMPETLRREKPARAVEAD